MPAFAVNSLFFSSYCWPSLVNLVLQYVYGSTDSEPGTMLGIRDTLYLFMPAVTLARISSMEVYL